MTDERELARHVIHEGFLAELTDPWTLVPDGYALVREIGRGGGGTVWLARDERLGRPVALKFLHEARAADLERLRRETRVTARLADPSIVTIYELGEIDEAPYIAMQYVDGGNLTEARLEPRERLRVVRDVARALHHAHREGIVHRDVKPQNVLVGTDGRTYVTDFGIARDLRGELGETLGGAGRILGTPGLMPPEQARGEGHLVDARSDVYALGATLYQMLTGRPPFVGAGVVEVLHAVIHDEVVPPRALEPSVPEDLAAIVMRCLRKAREERYATAAGVAAALDQHLSGRLARTDGAPWLGRLLSRFGGRAQAPTARDDHDPFLEQGLAIVRDLARWDADLYRVTGSLEHSFARLDAIERRLDAILRAHPDAAWARFQRGIARMRRGDLDAAREDMERSIDRTHDPAGASFELGRLYLSLHLREQRAARRHIHEEGTRHDLAQARPRLGQAVVAFDEARRLRGEVPAWHRDYALAVGHLADGDGAAAVRACDGILAREPDLEEVWRLRGNALRQIGEDPFESFERALAVRRTDFETLLDMAEAHLERGDSAGARAALERACAIHPDYRDGLALLAAVCLQESREAPDGARLAEARELALRVRALDLAPLRRGRAPGRGRDRDSAPRVGRRGGCARWASPTATRAPPRAGSSTSRSPRGA